MMRFLILAIVFLLNTSVFAHDCMQKNTPHKPSFKEQRQIEEFFNEKLNLTQEQKEILKKNRTQHRKEMQKIIQNMEIQHDKIRDVYYSGIPKFQADIKTAPMKAELVILKQNANKLRQEHRKSFESILTEEQNLLFQAFKRSSNISK